MVLFAAGQSRSDFLYKLKVSKLPFSYGGEFIKMEKNEIGMANSSEAVVDIESVEHRPLIMDRDSVDLEAGPGDQPQCRICLESDGNPSKPLV